MSAQLAGMKACFFAPVKDRELLTRVEFYRQDLECLRELGMEVTIATRWSEIPWDSDLYLVWWWTWAFQPLAKARLRRRPVLITGVFDHRWPYGRFDYYHRPLWQRCLLSLSLKCATANVFVSETEFTSVPRDLGAAGPTYIPLTVDSDVYAWGPGPREDFVLSVAWLSKGNAVRKCVFESVRAMALVHQKHPTTRLLIAGQQDTAFPELSDLVEELGLSDVVEFLGVVSQARKIELMQRCRVYLQPSLYEGFGLAVLEAMSCGAAVVSSPVGAVPEVVGDAGLLIDGRASEEIAGAICRLLDDEALCATLGAEARRRVDRLFRRERRHRELTVLLEGLVRGTTPTSPRVTGGVTT